MEPESLQGAVPVEHRCPARKADQRLHIRVRFGEVAVAVSQRSLIVITEVVIETPRNLVLTRGKWKQSAILLELVHDELVISQSGGAHKWIAGRRVYRQKALQRQGAKIRRQ